MDNIIAYVPKNEPNDGELLESGRLDNGSGWDFRVSLDRKASPPVRVEVCDTEHGYTHWVEDYSRATLLGIILHGHLLLNDVLSEMMAEAELEETQALGMVS